MAILCSEWFSFVSEYGKMVSNLNEIDKKVLEKSKSKKGMGKK